jgi:hypothetical protein
VSAPRALSGTFSFMINFQSITNCIQQMLCVRQR